jgi:hypothetical protein
MPLRQPPTERPYSEPSSYEPSQKWLGSPAFMDFFYLLIISASQLSSFAVWL